MSLKQFFSGVSVACLLALPAIAAEPLQPRGEISVKGGTDRSLLTTEFWAPLAQESDRVIYGDIRLMGDNDENREGNLGIGYRQIHKDAVLGAHGWIDRRRTQNNSTFHQLTLGVERLGHVVDARANVYVPLNNSRNITTPNIGQTSPYLAGSGIFYDTNGLITETPQYGVDGELGIRIPVWQKKIDALRVYGGGYYFFRDHTTEVPGLRIRTEAQINKAISVGARFQYDSPRGSQGFLEATLKFPFSAKKLYQTDYLRSRLDESPERDVDIVTEAKIDTGLRKAIINTTSGAEQRVIYVDNSNTAAGDGTKENPFNTLSAAQAALRANDILYISHGDGTSRGMDQGITIDKANISLIGSGTGFIYDNGKFHAQSGINFSGVLLQAASSAPVIQNIQSATAGDLSGNSILVTGGGNITITGIKAQGSQGSGIVVYAPTGSVYDSISITNNISTDNGGNNTNKMGIGILKDADSQTGNILIANNTIANTGTNPANDGRGIQISGAGITSALTITNNKASGNNIGMLVNSFTTNGSIASILVDNNNFSDNATGLNIYAQSGGRIDQITIQNVTSNNGTGTSGRGIYIKSDGANSLIGTTQIRNNTTNNNTMGGITFETLNTGRADNVNIESNITNLNTTANGRGIFVQANNASIGTATVSNNTIKNNTTYGIYTRAIAAGQITTYTASNNTIDANQNVGLYTETNTAGSIIGTINVLNNTTTNNTSGGIATLSTTSARIDNILIEGNISTTNIGSGINSQANGGSMMGNLTIRNNTANNNTLQGIYAVGNGTGPIVNSIVVTGNTANGNANAGITVGSGGTAVVTSAVLSNNITNNNTGANGNGLFVFANTTTASMSISISGNKSTGNSQNGIRISKTTSGVFVADMGGGALSSAGNNNITGNTGTEVRIDGYALLARNNYWGGGNLAGGETTLNSGGTIDTTGFLVTAP